MIPFLDFVNHDYQRCNCLLQIVESKQYDESFYTLITTREIKKGEEILIRYGSQDETSVELFAKYGFLPKGNEFFDRQKLQALLRDLKWSTTLDADQKRVPAVPRPEKQLLDIRVYVKELLSL